MNYVKIKTAAVAKTNVYPLNIPRKERIECLMKIAVTYENKEVFQHFGQTRNFKIYQIEDRKIISSQIILANGNGHGAHSGFLANNGVDILICGGIGAGAQNALASVGIQLFGGVTGNADKAVEHYINGTLNYSADTLCNKEHHHGKGHDHNCGEHDHV